MDWTSEEAIILSNPIGIALKKLSPHLPAEFGKKYAVVFQIDTYRTKPHAPPTSMSDSQEEESRIVKEEVELYIMRDGDKWKVDDAQLEAPLSLASYSAWADEQTKVSREEKQ